MQHVMLPHASVDGIAGLAELVLAAGDDDRPRRPRGVVGFEIDDLFPIVDALTMLGFATVDGGRIDLTRAGERFAGADIQQSKEIFRDAALERVPLVRRIHRALSTRATGRCARASSSTCCTATISDDESRAQLDTAIDWGRYAELFEYDAARGEIRLHVHADEPVPR